MHRGMDIPTAEQFVAHCEAFCARHDMAETRFGREATGEPQLLASIRGGRSPSLKVLLKVNAFIVAKDMERAAADGTHRPFSSASSEAAPIEPSPSSRRLLDSLASAARRAMG